MNNEEKIMQILETIAGDVSELKKGQAALEAHMNGLEKGQDILARQVSTLTEDMQEVRQSQVRMENELTEKVRALFDAREVQNNVNERIISTLDRIEAKVDVLQLETAHLHRVK